MGAIRAFGSLLLGVAVFAAALPFYQWLGSREARSPRGPASASWVKGTASTTNPDPLEPNPGLSGEAFVNFGSMAVQHPGFCLGLAVVIAVGFAGLVPAHALYGRDGIAWYLFGQGAGFAVLCVIAYTRGVQLSLWLMARRHPGHKGEGPGTCR